MKYKEGDRVKFIDEVGEGVVVAVNGQQVFVRDEHGFEIEVLESQLIARRPDRDLWQHRNDGNLNMKLEVDSPNVFNSAEAKFAKRQKKSKFKKEILEIDLHIHELVDKSAHLSNFQIIEIQLDHFKKMLAKARQKRYRRVIFIHGVGEGVLREEIRQVLRGLPNCKYVDADFRHYGQGATEVILWYN